MSLRRKAEIYEIAKRLAREMRRNPTSAEDRFWQAVRRKQIMGLKFYRQYPILQDITGNETFFIADFFCHRAQLVVEIDGMIHEKRALEDVERTGILNLLGLKVLRFRNEEVLVNLDGVIEKVRQVVVERIAQATQYSDQRSDCFLTKRNSPPSPSLGKGGGSRGRVVPPQ